MRTEERLRKNGMSDDEICEILDEMDVEEPPTFFYFPNEKDL